MCDFMVPSKTLDLENFRQLFFLCDMKEWSESRSVVSDSATPWTIESMEFWRITGVGSLSLLQGIFPTQGSNPGLSHCRQILYQLSCQGNQRILEWVAYPFSSGSFWPRNGTGVSCIADRCFTNWTIRVALCHTEPDGNQFYLFYKACVQPG